MSGRFLAVFAALLLGGFATTTGILLDVEMGNADQQITQLRGQLSQAQRAGQQTQAQFVSERAAFAQAEARIGGTHRDLITCADWQNLVLPVTGFDSFNGQISASGGPPSLPQHCVNQ